MAENFGVEDRGHFYDPVGALARRRRQPPDAEWSRHPPWRRRPAVTPRRSRSRRSPSSERSPRRIPRTTCGASTTGYLKTDGVAPDSTTETYAALRLEIENWRWAGVPFFIRTGKQLAYTQTELRLVFKHPPRLGFNDVGSRRRAEPARGQARPDDRDQTRGRGAPRGRAGRPEPITLDMEFAEAGRGGSDPVRGAPARGDGRGQHPIHQTGRGRGDLAGHAAAARCAAAGAPVRARVVGPRGGRRAGGGPRPLARTVDDAHERATARARRCPRRSRRSTTTRSSPIATPARSSRSTARSTGSACLASTRRASSAPCSTERPATSGWRRSGSTSPRRACTSRARTCWSRRGVPPDGWVEVRDALTMGPREGEDSVTPHTRPPADDDADHMLVRTVECLVGQRRDRADLRAGLRLRPRRRPRGRWSDDGRHAADATGAATTIRLTTDMPLGHRGGTGSRATHV